MNNKDSFESMLVKLKKTFNKDLFDNQIIDYETFEKMDNLLE